MQRRSIILVAIAVLSVALVFESNSPVFLVSAEPSGQIGCENTGTLKVKCCQRHIINRSPSNPAGTLVNYCTDCDVGPGGVYQNCSERYVNPTGAEEPTPFDPIPPLQGGVLEQQPQTPPTFAPGTSPGVLEQLEQGEGLQQGFLEQQQQQPPADQGAAELPPPATDETQPATAEEEQPVPVCQEGLEFNEDLGFCVPEDCPEGQVLDEESGICVLEEPEVAEEPEQPEPEEPEQQSSEEGDGDGSEDNSDNEDGGDNNN